MRYFLALTILYVAAAGWTGCKHTPFPVELSANDTTGTGDTTTNPGDTTTNPVDTTGNGTPCDPNTVYFVSEVLPIFQTNCAKSGCHNAASHQDGIILDSYSNIINTGDIEGGDPDAGKVYEAITEDDPDDIMPPPPHTPLTQAQINAIYTWIMQGAQNNECDNGGCDTSNPSYALDIKPIVQNRCIGCHSNALASGGYNFSTYQGLLAAHNAGRLHGAINHLPGFTPMPQNGTLTECELGLLNAWIGDGAPNN